MPVTAAAKRRARQKVLKKRLKEQKRNIGKTKRRVAKIEKELKQIEVDKLHDTGLLQQLTWEYKSWVRLFGCTAIGIQSIENCSNNEAVKKLQEWYWKHEDESKYSSHATISRKNVDDYEILIALHLEYADDLAANGMDEGRMCVGIFSIDSNETGTGHNSEKKALRAFAEKWNIKVEIEK